MRFSKKASVSLLVIMATFCVACSTQKTSQDTDVKGVDTEIEMSLSTLQETDKDDIQIIDIREQHQFIGWDTDKSEGGHIEGAIDFPKSWLSIEENKSKINNELKRREIDTSRKTVIYSDNNVETSTYEEFKELGFEELYVLEGGFNEYVEQDLEVEKMDNYQVLVHPEWVYDLVEDKKPKTFENEEYKVIEVDFGKDKGDYEKGHIPTAITIDDSLNHIEGERILPNYDKMPDEQKFSYWNRPSDEVIKSRLEEMGITKDTTVVLYGQNTTAAARLGVVMMYAGVEDVRLLNGGKALVKSMDMPLEEGINEYIPVTDFGVQVPSKPEILIDYEEELELVEDTENAVIASVRSFVEYKGEKSGYTYIGKPGEIKNSRFAYAGSDPYNMEDYRNIDDTMFNYNLMADRWDKWGITEDKKISFHCGTGWRASETYFYALAMGYENMCVYDGGWYEWHLKENAPKMEKGLPQDAPETEPNSFF